MQSHVRSFEPLLIPFSIKNNKVVSDYTIEEIRQNILSGKIVILKNVFSEERMSDLKKKIVCWGNETPIFLHGESPSKYPELNYHRIDDGSYAVRLSSYFSPIWV